MFPCPRAPRGPAKYTLALAALLAACGAPKATVDYDAAGAPAKGDTYVSATIGEASNLVPWLAGDNASSEIAGLIYDTLIKYDKDLNLAPSVAERWDVSDDGLRLTFHLRKDVTWADGKPLTSADVMATFKAITNPNTRTPYAGDYLMVKTADAPDPYTFTVTYDKPFAPALSSWAGLALMPKHILDETPDVNETRLRREPMGSGPWKLTAWESGKELRLTANPTHFEGEPFITNLRTRVITDQDTQFLELQNGSIDSMGLKPVQWTRLTDGDDFTRRYAKYRYLSSSYVYLGFNLTRPLFADKRLRQALSYATPREQIIQGVLMGQGLPAIGPFKPGTWAANTNIQAYPFDIEKAKMLLDQAGWLDSNGDGVRDKDGTPLRFTVVTNQGNDQRIKTAEIMQQTFKQVGVDMNIRVQEWATFIENTVNKRDFDTILLGWTQPPEPDPYDIFHSSKTGPKEFNVVGFSNRQVDELVVAARETFDQAKRKEALDKFQEVLHDEQPYLFIYQPYALIAVHKRFKGVEPAPAGIGHNFDKWYVPAEQQIYRDAMVK